MAEPRTYVTDLQDLLEPRGCEEDAVDAVKGIPAGKLGRYFALIVENGSLLSEGELRATATPCANPTRRKRCEGRLSIERPAPDRIDWECGLCGEHGTLHGWRGTRFDLSLLGEDAPARPGGEVVVPLPELWAMRLSGRGDVAIRRLLAETVDVGGGFVAFQADDDDLAQLHDAAVEAADGARGKERRLLDRFAGRMEAFRSTLQDFGEPPEAPIDLEAELAAGTSPEILALATEIAAEHARGEIMFEDMLEAESAWHQGRRPVYH